MIVVENRPSSISRARLEVIIIPSSLSSRRGIQFTVERNPSHNQGIKRPRGLGVSAHVVGYIERQQGEEIGVELPHWYVPVARECI
jgi:hypothetical protein